MHISPYVLAKQILLQIELQQLLFLKVLGSFLLHLQSSEFCKDATKVFPLRMQVVIIHLEITKQNKYILIIRNNIPRKYQTQYTF